MAGIALVVLAGATLSAHRRDEYLQAARLAVAPEGVVVELDLTPGMSIAGDVIGTIDRDRDGTFSRAEQGAYVSRLLDAMALDADGRPLRMIVTRSTFPAPDELWRGEGIIRIETHATMPLLSSGAHKVRFRNDNNREESVYLANALVPESARLAITAQRRNTNQSDLTIDFTFIGPPASDSPEWVRFVVIAAGCGVLVACVVRIRAREA